MQWPKAERRREMGPVDESAWVEQEIAAERLGIGLGRLALMLAADRFETVRVSGERGDRVSAASLEDQLRWRQRATGGRRLVRVVIDVIRALANGI